MSRWWSSPLVLALVLGAACAPRQGGEPRQVHDLIEQARWAESSAEGGRFEVDSDRALMWLAGGERVDFALAVPDGSSLAFDRLRSRGADEAALVVTFERRGDGEPAEVARWTSARSPRSVPLPDGASEISRLSFVAESGPEGGIAVWRPRVLTTSPAGGPVAAAAPSEGAAPEGKLADGGVKDRGEPPNVVLYLVDTLRMDHLGVYGYDRPVSPKLDELAERATVYERAVAQSPWTRPSVASIFTGLDPTAHGVNRREDSLAAEASTLAELLADGGYQTVGFFTNGNAGPEFGFAQGFEVFSKSPFQRYHANFLNEEVLAYLDSETRREPFFLYVHAADPHAPYEAFEPFLSCFAGEVEHPELGDMDLLGTWRRYLEEDDPMARDVRALYDAEVAFNDEYFGQLLDLLKSRGLFDDTLVIFVSDHGEEFWEHGDWSHGQSLYGELIDIPLVVKAPGQRTPERSSRLAQHIDLFATVLDYAGIDYRRYSQGASLRRLDGDGAERTAYSRMDVDGRHAVSLTDGEWKLIVPRTRNAGRRPMLFHRGEDPGERDDLYEREPIVAAYMMTLLRRHESTGSVALEPEPAVMSPETVEELRALGYID